MAVYRAVCAVADDAGWNGQANSYCANWGNGLEAPKGESDKDDISFSIDIERGSKTFHISVGEW